MLPRWFAEYTLYLGLAGLLLFVMLAVFGCVAASSDRFTGLLSDARRQRRPTSLIAVVASVAGIVVLTVGIGSSASHFGLAMAGIGSLLLLVGIVAGTSLPISGFWTNEYWKLPPPETMTADQARALGRTMGRVYAVLSLGCVIAFVGALVGIIPKLLYVGETPIPAIFLASDFALIVVGGIVGFKAWKLFQSVRVYRAAACI